MSKRIRLLCLLPNLNGGGAERVMMYLLGGLDRSRFDVTLGVAKKVGPYVPLIPADVPVIDFNVDRGVKTVGALTGLLREGRFDVCFSMMSMNFAAVTARLLSRADTSLVLGARNHYTRALDHEASSPRIKKLAVSLLYPRAAAVISVSDGVRDDLAANFGVSRSRIETIPNPIEIEAIRKSANAPVDHPWFSQPSDKTTIVAVGKLQAAKGHRFLIEAIARLPDPGRVRLAILGQGPLEAELRKQIDDRGLGDQVALLGFQQNPYAFLAKASLFVLSSLWEGFPNVVTEAMACGVPVVSTDCPSGPSEILRNEVSGLLVPPANAAALSAAIGRLLARPEAARALAEQASADVLAYDAPRIVSRYADVFARVAACA